jgi:DNA-binding XRE family transcriptional regulator
VRELRHLAGLSQEELAAEAGLHWTYVGGIERGKRNPSLVNIIKLARALACPRASSFGRRRLGSVASGGTVSDGKPSCPDCHVTGVRGRQTRAWFAVLTLMPELAGRSIRSPLRAIRHQMDAETPLADSPTASDRPLGGEDKDPVKTGAKPLSLRDRRETRMPVRHWSPVDPARARTPRRGGAAPCRTPFCRSPSSPTASIRLYNGMTSSRRPSRPLREIPDLWRRAWC